MNSEKRDLGIVLSTVTDEAASEIVELGQLAEQHGYSTVYVNEGRGDALACALATALKTNAVRVGTNIANIYFRHPFLAAQTARTIAELSGGRLILGLGMSHRQMLASLGIDMGDARTVLRDYTVAVTEALAGRAGAGFLAPPPCKQELPVYVAGNTVESAAVAGAVGHGLMPFLSPLDYIPTLLEAAHKAAEQAGRDVEAFGCVLSMPTFLSDDMDAAKSAARYNLAFFGQLPNYRRQWRRAGFGAVMDQIKSIAGNQGSRRDIAAVIPDELVEQVCVLGPPEQCEQQLDQFRARGVDEPVIAVSPVNMSRLEATRIAVRALAPEPS